MEAEILLAHALDVDRLQLYISPDKPLTTDERTRYRTVIQKRKSGVPLQHLIGEVTFFGLRFKVRRGALIPRPETEELLERSLKTVERGRDVRCIDLGTGTGVIAVCLARYLPRAEVSAVDVSPEALDLARENARLNGVEERIAGCKAGRQKIGGCISLWGRDRSHRHGEHLLATEPLLDGVKCTPAQPPQPLCAVRPKTEGHPR